MRIRLRLPPETTTKSVRNVHLFGDRPAWTLNGKSVKPMFRGYERRGNDSVTILARLTSPDGHAMDVRITPDRSADGTTCVTNIVARGLTADDVLHFIPPGRKPLVFQTDEPAASVEHTMTWTTPEKESGR